MSDETREEIEGYRERQMDRRKRERDERLGLVDVDEEDVKPSKKKKEEKVEEDKKKPMKYPAEGMFFFFFLCYCFFCRTQALSHISYHKPSGDCTDDRSTG